MCFRKIGAKWHFDIDIIESVAVDLLQWTLILSSGGQDSYIELYNQVVKVGEGWIELVPALLTFGWVTK
jgi:hypothetical protein